jgi:hypothetical protein
MNDLPLRPAADTGAVEDRFFTLRNFPRDIELRAVVDGLAGLLNQLRNVARRCLYQGAAALPFNRDKYYA